MANKEACELYIEQEIKSALNEGKRPWTIGKELASWVEKLWVEKLFEVTINPRTIERRAERLDNTTNVVKKSNIVENPVSYKPIEKTKLELTSQHVSDGTISWLIGHFSCRLQADRSVHAKTWEEVIAALLELKQRRAEDRQREAGDNSNG